MVEFSENVINFLQTKNTFPAVAKPAPLDLNDHKISLFCSSFTTVSQQVAHSMTIMQQNPEG